MDAAYYAFDDNGNLLNDGASTYTYDAANRLTAVSGPQSASYTYNGLGDRYQQTVSSQTTTYALDLNAGLTQVLEDGDNTYLYGLGRIAQVNTSTEYFMGDALGSVRQLLDGGDIVLAKSYAPYGEDLYSTGSGESAFAFTGEQTDPNGLVYLRARYYTSSNGRFLSRDTWSGDIDSPASFNLWTYANGNPVRYTDPSGRCIFTGIDTVACLVALAIGIPIVAGVTTGAYDLSITQGAGLGGHNAGNWNCINFSQVLMAGEGGTLGALNSEGEMLSSLVLFPTYIMSFLVYDKTPAEVNMNILSDFGLSDEYRAAMNDPNFVAGKYGGDAAMTYISLASFFKGMPTKIGIESSPFYIPRMQNNGTLAYTVLNLPGKIQVVGASGQLVYIGTAGFASQFAAIDGGGGGGGINMIDWSKKKPFEGVVHNADGTTTIYEVRKAPGADGGWSRIVKIQDAEGNTIKVIHEAWSGTSDPRIDPPDHSHVKFE